MCSGPDQNKSGSSSTSKTEDKKPNKMVMSSLTVETEDSFSSLLEYAANNDFEGFKRLIENDPSEIDELGLWYVRKKGSKQIVLEHRTPLMVAATYGSVSVLKLIISQPKVDVNFSCGPDKCTALHCAASGGSVDAVEVVKLLLSVGADPNIEDANGHRPVDVIVVPPKLSGIRPSLEELLMNSSSDGSVGYSKLTVSVNTSSSWSPTLSSSPDNGSPCSPSELVSSPTMSKFNDAVPVNSNSEKKEYPIDPSLPDIKNSIYSTDEFRMFSFKVRPCSRAYSHDWTECPFVHPGENARRRDPRKFHYSCVPCPDFRKGACRRADMCEYAHGVFECWLHPAQYRTRLCKDGTSCARRVCFFAASPGVFSPSHKSAVLNQFQQQQSILSPINTNVFSPKNVDHTLLQASFNVSSPGRMSPRSIDPISPMGARLSAFAQREKQHQQLRGLSSRDLGTTNGQFNVGSPVNTPTSWSKWGSPTGKVDWSVNNEFGKLKRSSSFERDNNGVEEPDLSWVQSLVKESPPEMMKNKAAAPHSGNGSGVAAPSGEGPDHSVLGAWLEQMQLDQLVA
ncbi:putative transcription factor C3H family [Helianthus annuus]|nr:putative transcription factor C3H family [Helianthus annuus]